MRTVMDSMSFGLMRERKFVPIPLTPPLSRGTPSRTIRGSFDAFNDAPPLILMVLPPVGEPPEERIWTPDTFPFMSCSGDDIRPSLKSLVFTDEREPVMSLFVVVP